MTVKPVWMAFLLGAAVAACQKDTAGVYNPPPPLAGLRYYDAVPDTGYMDFRVVDVVTYAPNAVRARFRTGGDPMGVSNGTNSPPYLPVLAGTRHIRVFLDSAITGNASNTLATDTIVMFDTTFNFLANTNYTFYLYGSARTPPLKALITADSVPTIASGQIAVRVLNLAPSLAGNPAGSAATAVDAQVGTTNSAVPVPLAVAANLGYKGLSTYTQMAVNDTSAPYRLAATATGSTSPILFQAVMPTGVVGTASVNPIAGTLVAGTAITALIVPQSVSGSGAPQTAAAADTFPIDSVTRSNDTVRVWKHIRPGDGSTTCATADQAGASKNNVIAVTGLTPADYDGMQTVVTASTGTSQKVFSQQTVTLSGGTTGSTFTLTLGGATTAPIAFDASAATVENVLSALSSIGAGNVYVTGALGGPYTVQFVGALAGSSVKTMTAAGTGVSVAVVKLSVGCGLTKNVKTIQLVTLSGMAAGDTFQLNFGTAATAWLSASATAAQVQSALQALSAIDTVTGNVVVTGNAGGPYTVTFGNAFANYSVPAMTATVSGAAGTITIAKQLLAFSGSATQSSFRYRIATAPVSPATGTMSYKIITSQNDFTMPTVFFLIDKSPALTAP